MVRFNRALRRKDLRRMKAKALRLYVGAPLRYVSPRGYQELLEKAPRWANHLAMCSCSMCSPDGPSLHDRVEAQRTKEDIADGFELPS